MSGVNVWRETEELLKLASQAAREYLESLPSRPVAGRVNAPELRERLGGPLPEEGNVPVDTLRSFVSSVERGLVATSGPRFFGFVNGGNLPVTMAADWLTSAWDQNAGMYVESPAASIVEGIAAKWLLEILGLPPTASVGFVTGCQMANFTALAAARNEVLARAGWDVEQDGLPDAPRVHIVVGAEAHATILTSLRMLGFGTRGVKVAEADGQGRMKPDALGKILSSVEGPTIVCAQAGNVNTGSFDPFEEIAEIAKQRRAWLHVDGAFGLWARASSRLRHLLRGVEQADSWATDAHKWLNCPYDSGIAIVRDPTPHLRATSVRASYLAAAPETEIDPMNWVPESSRRARGFTVYVALRSLGRKGITDLVDRCCDHARSMAARLSAEPAVEILNDVVLNQVLVRFRSKDEKSSDALTDAVIRRVQSEGTCWAGGTAWHGRAAMRISIVNWSTTRDDIEKAAAAILRCLDEERK